MTELGRLGLTAVGNTPEDAWTSYQRTESVLLPEASEAQAEAPVIG